MVQLPLIINPGAIKQRIKNALFKKEVYNAFQTYTGDCNEYFGKCCNCCGCPYCEENTHQATLQMRTDVNNNKCNTDPGCNQYDGDNVVTYIGTRDDITSVYEPPTPKLPLSKVCVWEFIGDGYGCSTDACDACTCSLTFDYQGFPCDPFDPPATACLESYSIGYADDCSDCNIDGCETNCSADLPTEESYCSCESDVLSYTGYSCVCTGGCTCNPSCAAAGTGIVLTIYLYLKYDLSGFILYVEMNLNGGYYTSERFIPHPDPPYVLDCSEEINDIYMPFTEESPAANQLCDPPSGIQLSLI